MNEYNYHYSRIDELNFYHYIYKITRPETGEFYIGLRSSKLPFEYDHDYFSSSLWIKHFSTHTYCKELIKEFTNRENAARYEVMLIKEYEHDDLCRNFSYRTNIVPKREALRKTINNIHWPRLPEMARNEEIKFSDPLPPRIKRRLRKLEISRDPQKRNMDIYLARLDGYKLKEIGELAHLTRERVRQICCAEERKNNQRIKNIKKNGFARLARIQPPTLKARKLPIISVD